MPAITEKAVKDRVKRILEPYTAFSNIYTFCPMTFGYGASGHPDRIILAGGHFLGVEIKKDANNYHCKPHLKPAIRAAGGDWLCIHSGNLDVLVDWLKTHAKPLPAHKQDYVGKLAVW